MILYKGMVMKNYSLCVIFILLLSVGFFVPREAYAITKSYSQGFGEVTKLVLDRPLERGRAFLWGLDYSGYAVKTPNAFMVFDYFNDESFRDVEDNRLERSLFTGVIEAKELEKQNVIVFFSHNHPGVNFPKTLEWRKKIAGIYYVITEDVKDKYQIAINAARAEDLKTNAFGGRDLNEFIKVVKSGDKLNLFGQSIQVAEAQEFLDPEKNTRFPGVEYIVNTDNGITIYHSGAFACHICLDPILANRGINNPDLNVISNDTKKMVFQDGKLVSVNGKGEGLKDSRFFSIYNRISLCMYAKESEANPNILIMRGVFDDYNYSLQPGGKPTDQQMGTITFSGKFQSERFYRDQITKERLQTIRGNPIVTGDIYAMSKDYLDLSPTDIAISEQIYGLVGEGATNGRLRSSFRYFGYPGSYVFFWGWLQYGKNNAYPFPADPRERFDPSSDLFHQKWQE